MTRFFKMTAFLGLAAAVFIGTAQAGKNLDAIKSNGTIKCGVSTGLAGFSPFISEWHPVGLMTLN